MDQENIQPTKSVTTGCASWFVRTDACSDRTEQALQLTLPYLSRPDYDTVIQFRPYKSGAKVPEYKTKGAAGFDIAALIEEEAIIIEAGGTKVVGTGLNVKIEEGYELQIRSRSGLAAKNAVFVLNSPGTIDHDYCGDGDDFELRIILHNAGKESFAVRRGDRIAQGVVNRLPSVEIVEWAEAFGDGESGDRKGGLGSTGV
jgi:dUTP pyrophosphatase